MYIPGPLLKTMCVNQFILVMTDCYAKFTKAVFTSKTAALHIVSLFLNNLVTMYGFRKYVLTNNGTNLSRKFLKSLCAFLGTKHITTTAYHLQTSG